jgi:ATP-dependent Clp protease ATP-binding subunit ClpA
MSAIALTPRMRTTLRRASEIAESRNHNYVGTEHMLLALLDDPDGIGGGVLHRLQVAERARAEVERIVSSAGYARVRSDTLDHRP